MHLWGWFLIRNMGAAFMETITGLSPSADIATQIAAAFGFSFSQLFAGYYIRESAIPRGWIWMHFLSLFKYGVQFFSINELHGLSFSCPNNLDAVDLSSSLTNANSTYLASLVANSNGKITCDGIDGTLPCYACPLTTGDEVLNVFDFHPDQKLLMMGCLIIW
jgi:hypothetical protein